VDTSPARSLSFLFALFALSMITACGDDDVAPPMDAGTDAGTVDAGPRPELFVELGSSTEGIALGRTPAGAPVLYVGVRDGRIVRVAPDGVMENFATVDSPVGIAVRATGEILVCGSTGPGTGASSVLFELDPTTGAKTTLIATGPGGVALGLCNYVAVAPDDSLVFSDSASNKLYKAAADGTGVALLTDTIEYPNGLAFSPDGATLYVASWSGDAMYSLSFDAATGAYGAPTSVLSGVAGIDGLVTLSDGTVVLVTSAAGVQRWTPGGASAVLFGPRLFTLPANGVMGDTAFGVNNLYLTSLTRTSIQRLALDTTGIALPVR
jgi:gluconolactonase